MTTRWQQVTTGGALFLAWSAFAFWQWREYVGESERAREALCQQGRILTETLVGSLQAPPRLGGRFQEQMQALYERLVASRNVLAVGVVEESGTLVLGAGQTDLLTAEMPPVAGEHWESSGLHVLASFEIVNLPDRSDEWRARGRGPTGRVGHGSVFSEEKRYLVQLVLDRARTDALCRQAVWLRSGIVIGGAVVLVCLGILWSTSVRLAQAQGRTKLLEAETRHLRELGEAAAGLAHETRNPLGLVRGWAQTLASEPGQGTQQGSAEAIVEECDRVVARLNQFLAFARPREPVLASVNVGEMVAQLTPLLETDLEEHRLQLQGPEPSQTPTIRADTEMLRQAVFNLLQNAIQFAHPDTTVEVRFTSGHNGSYRLEVADRGTGVATEDIERLFAPYFSTRPGGTGLGLAIVRRIATAHDWKAGYRPRTGGGSVFWLDGIHA